MVGKITYQKQIARQIKSVSLENAIEKASIEEPFYYESRRNLQHFTLDTASLSPRQRKMFELKARSIAPKLIKN
jgi:hypothetical protein